MESAKTQPVSLRELATTLFIYKWTIVVLTILFGGGAAIVSYLQPEIYEASVQMWAQDQSVGLRGASNYSADTAARVKIVLMNVREVIFSRQVLEKTLQRNGPQPATEVSEWTPGTSAAALDAEVESLRKAIRLEAPKGSDFGTTQIFFVRMRDRNPEQANLRLAAVLESFRERYEALSVEQAKHLVEETNLQLEKSREQLRTAERAMGGFVKELEGSLGELNSMGGSPGGDSELHKGLSTVNERLLPAQTELRMLVSFHDQMQKARTGVGEAVAVPGTFTRDYPGLDQSARELASARLAMDGVAARLTPENPEYQEMQERLWLVQNTYGDEMARTMQAVEREIATKREAVEYLQLQKDGYVRRVAELANKFVEHDGLKEDLRQRRSIVDVAEKRRSDAAHGLVTAAQETLFSVMDGPRCGLTPVSPQRRLNMAVGTLLGLLAGIGLAFLARQYSQTVRSEADLSVLGDDLVIVSIPKVRAPMQRVM